MWFIFKKKQVNGQVPNEIMSYFSKKTSSDPVHYSYVFYYFKYSISCFLEGMQGTIYIFMCNLSFLGKRNSWVIHLTAVGPLKYWKGYSYKHLRWIHLDLSGLKQRRNKKLNISDLVHEQGCMDYYYNSGSLRIYQITERNGKVFFSSSAHFILNQKWRYNALHF